MTEILAGSNRLWLGVWKWKWLAVFLLPAIFHAPLFTWLASSLVVDQWDEPADTWVLLFPRQGGFQAMNYVTDPAAISANPDFTQCLLIDAPPGNLVRGGVESPFSEKVERLLPDQRSPLNRWNLVLSREDSLPSAVESLGVWLRENPGRRVGVLFDRFHSRELSLSLRQHLDRESFARVAIYPLPAEGFDETDWWKSRRGVNRLAHSLPRLWYIWCNGDDAPN